MRTDVSAHAALPGPLRLQPSFPFVDRPREMATLRSLLPRAQSEGRRIALVGGEPGSGKSRLVREIAHQAAKDGALVLYGACDAVVRTPYRPFVEALDQLVRASDPDELRADLGPAGGELTRLLPDLRSRVGDLPEPVVADQDTERHRLNAAVSDLLVAAGRRRPLLLVFEDGHWADTPTLLLAAPPRGRRHRGANAAGGHVPRHRGRRAGRAVGGADRHAALGRGRAGARRRAHGRAGVASSSSARPGRRWARRCRSWRAPSPASPRATCSWSRSYGGSWWRRERSRSWTASPS